MNTAMPHGASRNRGVLRSRGAPGRGPAPASPRTAHRAERERGSATVWTVCVLTLISAAVAWMLLWTAAESTRHSAERAADTAALTAARAALSRLDTEAGPAPCDAAALAARRAGVRLASCVCAPLDCSVSVVRKTSLLGSLTAGLTGTPRIGTVQAASRAGPVGESGPADAFGSGAPTAAEVGPGDGWDDGVVR